MGEGELIGLLALAGLRLSVDGPNLIVEPRSAITDELRTRIRDSKPQLMQALTMADGAEFRRQRALAELQRHPDKQRWAIFDPDAAHGIVICTIAIRQVGTCELQIPQHRYDPWLILDAMERASEH